MARLDGILTPLGRSGYLAVSSKYEQHRLFALWVMCNQEKFDFLEDGERVCGEWLAQAHSTRYQLKHDPFVAFDIMRGVERTPYQLFEHRTTGRLVLPRLLHIGSPCTVDKAMSLQDPCTHGAIDPIEGAVWRIERKGKVDFLCKYVRPDKKDGVFLPGVEGSISNVEVWNWRPFKEAT